MLTVNIICIGKLKEKYWISAVDEYSKRLRLYCKLNIIELSEERLPDNPSSAQIEKVISAEGERIVAKLSCGSFIVAMCVEGEVLSSEEFSEKLSSAAVHGYSSVDFVIGGSYGLSDTIKSRAKLRLSMGRMTFPHQMARVILCEQIYRGFQIAANGKYHK